MGYELLMEEIEEMSQTCQKLLLEFQILLYKYAVVKAKRTENVRTRRIPRYANGEIPEGDTGPRPVASVCSAAEANAPKGFVDTLKPSMLTTDISVSDINWWLEA